MNGEGIRVWPRTSIFGSPSSSKVGISVGCWSVTKQVWLVKGARSSLALQCTVCLRWAFGGRYTSTPIIHGRKSIEVESPYVIASNLSFCKTDFAVTSWIRLCDVTVLSSLSIQCFPRRSKRTNKGLDYTSLRSSLHLQLSVRNFASGVVCSIS